MSTANPKEYGFGKWIFKSLFYFEPLVVNPDVTPNRQLDSPPQRRTA
jgi:hypothetical protein